MSDQTAATPHQPAQVATKLTAADILLAFKENFVVLSAAAAVIGITLATTFFGAYLSVFDWRLLWYVQYTDVLTFGIIANRRHIWIVRNLARRDAHASKH